MEMRAYQIERGEIADAFVQRGGALEVGEQERQRRDLEPLVDVEIVGLVDVAKGLVGEHALGGQDRFALAQHFMQRIAGDPDRGKYAHVGLIFKREPQRSWTQLRRTRRRMQLVEHDGKLLTLAGRFAADGEKLRGVGDRLEYDDEL